ncbi:histamine H2 receptor [Exaiptasia diaphana]|uniref:G-protein coupled receptors family 1 profile domain-containing protein n=1 Tax=Exaiptasia diaphana TaxID=2652724 RepID=A0A913WQF9_EXADI|nr:histamine H2 receptor [Exaiptasia diaphana]XP_020892553.1 histamine H2 receptor [Exaiptasia diaphana]XP_020892561.1 histamine H2 receptor [Exaiptasia diaphana]XP_020892570.1 histamine H2 receptor [Exaiptasia diaphana]XP_028512853.1 histamine H2 receptor [Exaiptasia diaphana]KXJ21112.1 Beta-4C adrenergic receptor [Exaiptasia diaphana]
MENKNKSNNSTSMAPFLYTEDYLMYDSFLGVLSFFIVTVNTLVLFVFIYKPQIRTKTNCLLASLAASDLSMGLFGIPMYIGSVVTNISWLLITSGMVYRFIAVSTMCHILAITVERYVFIIHPMNYVNVVKRGRLYGLIACIWIFSLSFAVIQLAWIDVTDFYSATETKVMGGIIYHSVGVTVCFVCPFLAMTFIYAKMFSVIHRQVSEIRRQHIATESQNYCPIYAELRAISVFATMLAIFAFCWVTWYISVFEQYLKYYDRKFSFNISEDGYLVIDFLRFCTSLVNPLLYIYIKKDFRNAFSSVFRCKTRFSRQGSSSYRSQGTTHLYDTQYTTCTYEDTKC